jgi:hypothetical protein
VKKRQKQAKQKNWQPCSCQFFHIMGNAYQSSLGIYLLQTSQMESAEAHVVFDDPKNRLHFDRPLGSQALTLLTGEVGSGLAAIFQ